MKVVIDTDLIKSIVDNNHVKTVIFNNKNLNDLTLDTERIWWPCYKGCDWSDTSYTWSNDYLACTAARSCGNDSSHDETVTVETTSAITTPATCTKDGVETYTATFGDLDWVDDQTKEKPILASHTSGAIVIENKIEATCTTNGSYDSVVYCTVCGKELSRISETVKALGHSESDWIIDVAPTCITSGFRHTECTRCGEIIKEEEFYLSHNYINGNCEHCGATSEEYFNFTLLEDDTYSITVKDYINIPTNVVIPRVHDGRTVTNIGSEAFRYCMGVTSVVIPDCVTSISDNAFYLCKSITSIDIPSSVTTIGSSAFESCDNLESIIIPDSVTSIGSEAFRRCSSLTSVVIGDSVTYIGSYAFEHCTSLTSVVIPNSITAIEFSAFRGCTSLTYVVIPDGVTYIGGYAFEGCTGLVSIVLPKSVTSTGNYPFSGCSNLASAYFCGTFTEYPPTVDVNNATIYYYSEEPKYSILYKCWRWVDGKPKVWCKHTIVIDKAVKATCTTDGLTEGSHCSECGEIIVAQEVVPATGHNYGPITVTTNHTCTKFGNGTRKCVACGNVAPVIIDKLPHKYGDWYAYEDGYRRDCTYGCNHYEISSGDYAGLAFTLLSDGTYAVSALDIQAIPSVLNIPGTYNGNVVSTIDDYAFEDCVTITKVRIPDTITTIGWGAFAYCSMLDTVEIGENSRLKSIGSEAFYECTELTTINLPNSLETIGDSAFALSFISTITIPDNVTSIGTECFYDSNLHSITFGANSRLTNINERTFLNCEYMTSITIPSSITWIWERAFDECHNLTTLTFADGSKLEGIMNRAFRGCGLTSLTLPEGCLCIQDSAFSQCTNLATINLPSTLEAIGEESAESVFHNTAYYNDDTHWNKGTLYIGEYLICIREEEFSGGGGIFIPSIKTVATGAVSGWSKNAEIVIPLSVDRIQPCAIVDSENVTVYCEAESKPEGWVDNWCDDTVTVVWGYSTYLITEDGEYLTDEQGNKLMIEGD